MRRALVETQGATSVASAVDERCTVSPARNEMRLAWEPSVVEVIARLSHQGVNEDLGVVLQMAAAGELY
jgi:hypothetical protein